MRLGASSFIWVSPCSTDNVADLARKVKGIGYEVLEVAIEDPSVITADAINQAAQETGLAVSICGAFGPDRDVSHEDASVRDSGMTYLRTCVDLAAAVGSPNVAGPMYATTGRTRLLPDDERKAQFTRAAESLRSVAQYADEQGVGLAIEPLNRFETDLVNTVEQGLQLCEEIGEANVGLLLDTFHMNIEEKSVGDAVRAAGSKVFHVQASENDRGTPGTGHVPWTEFFDALGAIDYDGDVVVESFIPEIEEIARAVSLWRPVAPSMDELGEEGFTFLSRSLQ